MTLDFLRFNDMIVFIISKSFLSLDLLNTEIKKGCLRLAKHPKYSI